MKKGRGISFVGGTTVTGLSSIGIIGAGVTVAGSVGSGPGRGNAAQNAVGERETQPRADLNGGRAASVEYDCSERQRDEAIELTSFGRHVRAEWLNRSRVGNLENLIPEAQGIGRHFVIDRVVSHSFLPRLMLRLSRAVRAFVNAWRAG